MNFSLFKRFLQRMEQYIKSYILKEQVIGRSTRIKCCCNLDSKIKDGMVIYCYMLTSDEEFLENKNMSDFIEKEIVDRRGHTIQSIIDSSD